MPGPTSLPPAYTYTAVDTASSTGHGDLLHQVDRAELRALWTKFGLGADVPAANEVLRGLTATTSDFGPINHAYLDNRTRYLYVPATAMEAIIGAPTLTTHNAAAKAWVFSASADQAVAGSVIIPSDWASGNIAIYAYWFGSVGGEGGNSAQCQAGARSLASGASIDVDYTALGGFQTGTANVLGITLLSSNAVAGIGAGEWSSVVFRRRGDDVGDTYTGTTGLLGLRLEYTADM